jgi:hypothetical protein
MWLRRLLMRPQLQWLCLRAHNVFGEMNGQEMLQMDSQLAMST